MKYRVEWIPSVVNDLSEIWLAANSADRRTISEASQEIDRLLHEDAEDLGESRTDDRRILLNAPLGVTFRILPRMSVVQVLDIWRTRPPRSHGPRSTGH